MRRADRLFQLVQLLRRRRSATAAWLAERLEVSERTVYRDVRELIASGVPIQGEAGVGYALAERSTLPPLTFTPEEIAAVVLGARTVQSWGDQALASAASSALARIEAVLPEGLQGAVGATALFAPRFHVPPEGLTGLGELRAAVADRRKVRLGYRRSDGEPSARRVRPLGLFFWGHGWSLLGWCELRGAFRNFRLDRVESWEVLEERFADEPGRTLGDFLLSVREP